MLSIGDSILRGVNFILLIIALGLTGSLAATTVSQSNPQVNFCVFAAAFGILFSSFYGVLAFFFEVFAWPVLLIVFDFLNLVFTFAGATALAAAIRVHSCSNDEYVDNNKVAQGSSGRCRKSQASVAFLYISCFIFIFSSGLQIVGALSGGLFSGSRKSSARVGVPTMSQV